MSLDTYISGKWKFNNTITFTSSGVWSWGFTSNGGTYKRITYNSTDNSMYYYGDTSTSTTDVCVYKQGAWTNQNFRVIDLGTEPVHVFNGGYEFLADRAHSLYVFKRLYDRDAVEMPTVLYTPDAALTKYAILPRVTISGSSVSYQYYVVWYAGSVSTSRTDYSSNSVTYCYAPSTSYAYCLFDTFEAAVSGIKSPDTVYSTATGIYFIQGTSMVGSSYTIDWTNYYSSVQFSAESKVTKSTFWNGTSTYKVVSVKNISSDEVIKVIGEEPSYVFHWLSTEPPIPFAPVITLTEVSESFPNGSLLSWPAVDSATGYRIYSNGTYIPRPDESIRTYDMSAANIAGTYSIYVTAYNNTGESEASNTVSFVVKPKLAAPVIVLTIPAHGSGENAGGGTIK